MTVKQKSFAQIAFDKNTKIIFINGPAGSSKAQPLDSDILGKNGWIKMGDIKPNCEIYGEDGQLHKVISIHPQGLKDVYKISFSDGTSTECTLDHLWLTQTSEERNVRIRPRIDGKRISIKKEQKSGKVRTTQEILDSLYIRNNTRVNHSIPMVKPICFEEKNHYINPYVLGALLGDGCFRASNIMLSCAEEEILKKVSSLLPNSLILQHINKYDYSIKHINRSLSFNGNCLKNEIKELGLLNHYSYEKFIPNEYLFDSVNNRIELLRGLLDTDGHISKNSGSVYYTTTSEKLMLGVKFLVESLGGVCSVSERVNFYTYNEEKKCGRNSYSLCICMPPEINPFSLSRKHNLVIPKTKYKPIRYITNIELISKKECQCILVDNPSHLYITNNFIVTHNTFLAVYCALHILNMNPKSEIKYIRTIAESGERALGSLPGTVDEKFNPFMMPLYDKLDELLPMSQSKYLETNGYIEALPINFLRGATWNEKIIIADESQNYSNKELVTLLTRIGEGTKMFICGDAMQSDIGNKSGFMRIYDLFNNKESEERGIYCFQFDEEDIMRSEILKYIVSMFKKLDKTNTH